MSGLSQLELDALCSTADDGPPSPQDSCLSKRKRRVTLSAMTAEIAALEQASDERPGISQAELDELAVIGDARSSSPISSRLQQAKRSRLSVSQGQAGATARAAQFLGVQDSTGGLLPEPGLSQEELDAIAQQTFRPPAREVSTSQSPVRKGSKRRVRKVQLENAADENMAKSKEVEMPSDMPESPVRRTQRSLDNPLSPVKLN